MPPRGARPARPDRSGIAWPDAVISGACSATALSRLTRPSTVLVSHSSVAGSARPISRASSPVSATASRDDIP